MSMRPLALVVVLLAVVGTSVSVVYSKHKARKLFIELEALNSERDDMDIEWGQLQLEQSTLTTQGQVERAARDQLGMVSLSADNVVIVKP
jgi:cell division protein FtsL